MHIISHLKKLGTLIYNFICWYSSLLCMYVGISIAYGLRHFIEGKIEALRENVIQCVVVRINNK